MESEIELKKLANDEFALRNARTKIIADTIKVIFSAGMFSLATVFINNEYQDRQLQFDRAEKLNELEIARIEKENEFIRQFVNDISDESIEVKKEITNYFSILLPDGDTKASLRWKRYGEYIDGLIAKRERIKEDNEKRAQEYIDIQTSLAQANEELSSLKSKGQYEKDTLTKALTSRNELELRLSSAQDDIDNNRSKIAAINFVKNQNSIDIVSDDPIDKVLPTESAQASFWSFVGTFRNDVYVDRTNFQIHQLPEKGMSIIANVDVHSRSREPRYSLVRGWTLGNKTGLIKAGGTLDVEDVALIPAKGGGYRVWVRGKQSS